MTHNNEPPSPVSQIPSQRQAGGFQLDVAPLGASHFAVEFRRLRAGVRTALRVPDPLVTILDFLVALTYTLLDDTDERLWSEKLETFFDEEVDPHLPPYALERLMRTQAVTDFAEAAPEWVRRMTKPNSLQYYERLLGAATYYRVKCALDADVQVLTIAARRLVRAALPLVGAVDGFAATLTAEQRKQFSFSADERGLLGAFLSLDDVLDKALEHVNLPVDGIREDERTALVVDDFIEFSTELRRTASGRSQAQIALLSKVLRRKMQGARDALAQHTADPVSQSATSAVEFIDRLLRTAFPQAEVLAWIDQHYSYPEVEGLTFMSPTRTGGQIRRPTKRGEVLCFLFAGQPVQQRSTINELIAAAIGTSIQTKLQRLKHADDDDVEAQKLEVAECLEVLEAFVYFSIGFSWALADESTLEKLRGRLDSASTTPVAETAATA